MWIDDQLVIDSWTCTTYDARERVLTTVIPAFGSKPGRTITNNWAVNGNPLTVSSSDDKGTITTTTDLLGRTVSYTDTLGNTTTSTYDNLAASASAPDHWVQKYLCMTTLAA